MITVYKQWETLSTKLAGLINAVTLFYQIPQKDHLGTAKLLKEEIKANIELIIKFQESANTPQLSELIDSFSNEKRASLNDTIRGCFLMNASAWRKARKRVDLDHVRVHDLKHTFGRRLRSVG